MEGYGLLFVGAPRSEAQQKYTQERLTQLAEQRRRQNNSKHPHEPLERTISTSSTTSANLDDNHRRANDYGDMEYGKASTTTSSTSSSQSDKAHQSLLKDPYELRHGRRYLREVSYPLPVDLAELSRQNLRTLLSCKIFGRAVCSPQIKDYVPQTVLEIGCGSAYWSAMCHDYFASLGHKNVSFVGLDIAPLPPDLKPQGIDFTFVQHDLRRIPLPFDDEQFDLVMLKDASLILPLGITTQRLVDETIRILRQGGILEIWESDHVIRSLPRPPAPSKSRIDQDVAATTATFPVTTGTTFAPAENKYLRQANGWIQEALDRLKLPPTPCARIEAVLYQEPDSLENVGAQRLAIPLSEMTWEEEIPFLNQSQRVGKRDSTTSKGKGKVVVKPLTASQAALRKTALLTVLQMIESLEPLLRDVSEKNSEEWSHWWASMMSDVWYNSKGDKGGLANECLEIGAWWGSKVVEQR